jgi:hypothetical protein
VLADLGHAILGLDIRDYADSGRFVEVPLIDLGDREHE